MDNPAVGMGFQIFITPDEENGPFTAERIRHDLPDLPMDEVMEFTLPDETPAVRFVSHAPVLGDVAETWFGPQRVSLPAFVSAPDRALQDAWVREFVANLTFSAVGPPSASTPQQ